MTIALATHSANQPEAQFFRRLIVTNSRYWLTLARDDTNQVLSETPQVFRALEYALLWPAAWETARDLLLQLSPLMFRQGHGLAWESPLRRGIERSAEEEDPAEIELRLELGNFYRLQGRLPEARACLHAALALCDRYDQRAHERTLLNYLGLVARLSGQHEEALAYCQQVLAEPNLSSAERAEAFNVMGLVAYDCRQWEKALNYFEQTLDLYRPLNDTYQTARILNNRGLVFLQSKRWDEAEINFREAIRYFQVADEQVECFKAIMNLGNVFLMKQAYKTAIKQYQTALPIFQQYNYMVDLAHTYNNLGMAYRELTDWQAAEAYFLSSIELWQNLGDNHNLANVLDNFGNMFIKANRLERANEVLNQALQILSIDPNNPANTRVRQVVEDRLERLKIKMQN